MVSCSQSRRDNQASLRPDAPIFSSSACLVSRKRLKPRRERNKIVGLRKLSTAPVAQLDRVPDYESGGYRFESCRARQSSNPSTRLGGFFLPSQIEKGHRPLQSNVSLFDVVAVIIDGDELVFVRAADGAAAVGVGLDDHAAHKATILLDFSFHGRSSFCLGVNPLRYPSGPRD